ncbi:H-NS family nucleoid-associated regulatory protein [Burkholderia mayonis]|uniref:H-NS histone family protein n=1 Tax=Burkholderia mayonis TaxID=1385591 RepID=UPI0009EB8DB4|nr:H-NS histone family protein [Burkholderia mayonis]
MSKYEELKVRLQILAKEAEAAREREIGTALSLIRDVVRTYGILPEQINSAWTEIRGAHKRKEPVPPKYRNPATGQTWSGRGRSPKWIAGLSRDDFLIARPTQS